MSKDIKKRLDEAQNEYHEILHQIFNSNFDRVDKIRGLDITILISSLNKNHSYELLNKLNFPFIKKQEQKVN